MAAGICDSVKVCPKDPKNPDQPFLGRWVIDEETKLYTGRLEEPESFVPFTNALGPAKISPEAEAQVFDDMAKAGVTTINNGGAMTMTELNAVKGWALTDISSSVNHPSMRVRQLAHWKLADDQAAAGTPLVATPVWDGDNHGIYGAYGIKIWTDGSTQGCTAYLKEDYSDGGLCEAAKQGGTEYAPGEIKKSPWIQTSLEKYWNPASGATDSTWMIHAHVNGDLAITEMLDALQKLNAGYQNPFPVTLLHFTVGGDIKDTNDMLQAVADIRAKEGTPGFIDLTISHLIGHVAFWGNSFESIIGNDRVELLAAAKRGVELGIPVSLHSDLPTTAVRPLYYIEQAVTRDYWIYPDIGITVTPGTLPGGQALTTTQALQAVTTIPAKHLRLDDYIGSISVGKAADLVVLSASPLAVDPQMIHKIEVQNTFVNGYKFPEGASATYQNESD